jgi:hypothetical protein
MARLFTILYLFIHLPLPGQTLATNGDNLLEWNEFYHLQWDDFRGKTTVQARGDAGTTVLIKVKPYRVGRVVMYDVHTYFNRAKSWCRDKSNSLLEHERLHFDLAELYARMIRKKIEELNSQGIKDVKIYNRAIDELLQKSNETDQRYDLETLHGALPKKQDSWEIYVKQQLMGLKDYKKRTRFIV